MTRSELRSPLYSPWRMNIISINHIKLINTIIIIIISINIINTNMIKSSLSPILHGEYDLHIYNHIILYDTNVKNSFSLGRFIQTLTFAKND
jgi:hypothetical protein